MTSGFINVLKPVGATASDVVVQVKKILGIKKVGHLGTLDPGAAGVLPVAVGSATKLFDFLTAKRKKYRAFFTFGKTTDTLDAYGKTTAAGRVPEKTEILQMLPRFVGDIDQMPPAYSAVSVGGVRAYKLARGGAEVQLKTRRVTVFSFTLLGGSDDTYVFDIECSGGTYIRSLARDLAQSLGTVGYMSGLIRLSSGYFTIENALRTDEIATLGTKALLPVTYPLADCKIAELPDKFYLPLLNGVRLPMTFDGVRQIYCKGEFFGLAVCENNKLVLKYYLKND